MLVFQIPTAFSQTDSLIVADQNKLESQIYSITNVKDSNDLKLKIDHWLQKQINKGYWLASVDTLILNPPMKALLYTGSQYKLQFVELDSTGLSMKSFLNKEVPQLRPIDLYTGINLWIQHQAMSGFPFSSIQLSSAQFVNDTIKLSVFKKLGPKIHFRQTEQRNRSPLRNFVLNRLTGIFPNAIYNQKLVEGIPLVFNNLHAVRLSGEPRVLFLGDEGIVWLYLEKNKLNRFDFVLGFNPEPGLTSKKFRLTGEGGFELHNSFRLTERIFMKYENLSDQSPRLNLGFDFPYLYKLPIGVSQLFNLYKFKEDYLDLYNQSGLSYPIAFNQKISATFNYLTSSLLNPDTTQLLITKRLPSQLDYKYVSGGFNYHWSKLDNVSLPLKGFYFKIDLRYGQKKIKENTILLAYNSDIIKVKEQYDSLNLNKDQAIVQLNFEYYFNFARRHVLKLNTNVHSIFTNGNLVSNELIRIGGFKDLRGFDEDFFKCSDNLIQTFEYRFFLDRTSYLNVFSDFAYLNQSIGNSFDWTFNAGMGLGIQFQTKIGNFSLQYALGQSKDQNFDFAKGKIHFGYTNFF
ncbi:MAG TPA: hypothetical protein PLS73_04390 [Saprospiraceae bacterium]|nr:hypothetical protein [Saprospiraceae bacterium]